MMQNNRFNLETALAAWQRTLAHRAALTDDDREELAQHIRDQVETLMLKGVSEEDAFHRALRQMGHAHTTEAAYWNEQSWREKTRALWPMFTNYVVLAYRNMQKNKVASAINIVGLTLAIAVCIIVYLTLRGNWDIDGFHVNGERIFLIEHTRELDHRERREGWSFAPLGPALMSDMPQVEHMVRVRWDMAKIEGQDRLFHMPVLFADSEFFDMFTFPLRQGTPDALQDPFSVVLSASQAERLFGDNDPIGQALTLFFDDSAGITFTVRGVAEPFPLNASFDFWLVANIAQMEHLEISDLSDWSSRVSATLVQLHDPEQAAEVEQELQRYLPLQHAAMPESPITSFYLNNLVNPLPGSDQVIQAFASRPPWFESVSLITIATLLLLLACFNYVNIALGSGARRLKEIGMRKVMGGQRRDLIFQFLAENIVICTLALIAGVLLVQYGYLPWADRIPNYSTEHLVFSWTDGWQLYAFLVVLLIGVGLISGAYPAFYISSFSPTVVFRGKQKFANKKGLTYTLLTIQFTLSFIAVMCGTMGVALVSHFESVDWGYDPSPTVLVTLEDTEHYERFVDIAVQHPDIEAAEGAMDPVGRSTRRANAQVGETIFRPIRYRVEAGYVEALGLRLKQGRLFNPEVHAQTENGVLINETFVAERGWTEPLGQSIKVEGETYTVLGVVEDFIEYGMPSLFLEEATVFQRNDTGPYIYVSLRIPPERQAATLTALKAAWKEHFPVQPFRYIYQADIHSRDNRMFAFMNRFAFGLSGIALLLACMGLFGLAWQNHARRLKEVGIRKTLGASPLQLVTHVNRGFLILLVLAIGLGTAIVVTAIQATEHIFTLDLPFGVAPFIAAGILVLIPAIISIAFQTRQLVRTNPADVLRVE